MVTIFSNDQYTIFFLSFPLSIINDSFYIFMLIIITIAITHNDVSF